MSDNWICECHAGRCRFKTKLEALEAGNGKFCGRKPVVKRRKESRDEP